MSAEHGGTRYYGPQQLRLNGARLSVIAFFSTLLLLYLYRESWYAERAGDMDFYRDQVQTMNAQIYKYRRTVRKLEQELAAAKAAAGAAGVKAHDEPAAPAAAAIDLDNPGATFVEAWARLKAREGAVSDKVGFHHYEVIYERYLSPLRANRSAPFKVLEIGLGCAMNYGGGRGYQLLKEYAPNVDYYAIELNQQACKGLQHLPQDEREALLARTVWGDQGRVAVLQAATERFGPFDLIIDDGSHVSSDMITSLTYLFEHALKPGRTYIVEDTFFAFIRQNGGSRQQQQEGATIVTMLRDLLTLQQHYWWWTDDAHKSPMAKRDGWITEFGLAPRAARGTAGACDTGVHKYRLLDWIRTIDCDRGICAVTKRHDGPFTHRVSCPGDAASCPADNY